MMNSINKKLIASSDMLAKVTSINWMIFGIIIISLYFIPYIILGTNSYIRIHDNLDSEFIYRVLLTKTGWFPDSNIILNNVMNGLQVTSLPSKINISFIFYLLLPPLFAHLFNEFIIKIIAFIGMYFLINRYVLNKKNNLFSFIIALAFCFIPFFSIHGLTTAGQPLLFFAFLNLKNHNNRWYNYLIIILFGFYSSVFLSGIFILFLIFSAFIVMCIKTKEINTSFFIGLITLFITYVISEYQLIYSMFFSPDFISHRTAWLVPPVNFITQLKKTTTLLLNTQYHSGSLSTKIIIISTLLSLFTISHKKINLNSHTIAYHFKIAIPKNIPNKLLISLIIVTAILLFVFCNAYIKFWFGDKLIIIKTFKFDRFYFLLPAFFMIIFTLSLELLIKNKFIILAILLIILQITSITFSNKDYLKNLAYATNLKSNDMELTYKKYFDTDLFSKISNYIRKNKNTYRIVSIGIHPSITQYNSFFTLDSYQNNYSLCYKHQFRKIIENELEKSQKWREYFDNWGSRCYVFSSELNSFEISKYSNIELNNLRLNTKAFKDMGGEYVFSSVKINNNEENNLLLEKIFETDSSYWRIYLYSVK